MNLKRYKKWIKTEEYDVIRPKIVTNPEKASEGYGFDLTILTDKDIDNLKSGTFLNVGCDGEYEHYLKYDNDVKIPEE